MTRTGRPKPRAMVAVSSVHPLQTTITSSSPGLAPSVIAFNVRAMTERSLKAGMTIEIMTSYQSAGSIDESISGETRWHKFYCGDIVPENLFADISQQFRPFYQQSRH